MMLNIKRMGLIQNRIMMNRALYSTIFNHVFTPVANLSRCMHHVKGVYTQWFNRRHNKDKKTRNKNKKTRGSDHGK